jgi:hypothetical protein|tara:strand:+ start:1060 stop:1779 length:720 start_codon:yes stop_codon:yes gene_type:complete
MSKIATYINDDNVVGADKWIGSDSQNQFQTKNFTAEKVAEYLNREAIQSQLLRYKYLNEGPRTSGSISFSTFIATPVNFSTVTSFRISESTIQNPNIDVSSFYTSPLITSSILLTQCDDITNWAIYTWDSSIQNDTEPFFYDIGLTYKNGQGSLNKNKEYFISLLSFEANSGGDKNFVAVLDGTSSSYLVTHNLNKFPAVSIVDNEVNENAVNATVEYVNRNQVKLTFNADFTGRAFFN